ncbi:N-formylglutamate amidohydrolase [Brevundimonas sp.]|uniref:N-formylglutamate amidohydrolase n=1 Tax=Brevundimonas sp. TaxID=1871086 RepID=UPI0035B08EB3
MPNDPLASPAPWWTLARGDGPVLATAIHDGHAVRTALADRFALDDAGRLREEDPFTGDAIHDAPNRFVAHRSRFEVDLNRPLDTAVYQSPDQCWGLEVWRSALTPAEVEASRDYHRRAYAELGRVTDQMAEDFPAFVVLDVHSYNHRRDGADAAPTPVEKAPDINIGTFSMPRERWAHVVDPYLSFLSDYDFNGRRLSVAENLAFQGKGEWSRFVHDRHPKQGCAIAFEFKKFFMDEWTRAPDPAELDAMRRLMRDSVAVLGDLIQSRDP